MSLLLRLIPEPWASALLAGTVLLAYAYGNITGVGSERLRNTSAILEARNRELTTDLANAISMQTQMANRVAEVRAANTELQKRGIEIEKSSSTPQGKCTISDADRVRLQSIRIGRPQARPNAR
jgi:hypothetical protein